MNQKRVFNHIREDTCIRCGKDRSIELYDRNGNFINFTFILDNEKYFLLDKRQIYYAKCKNCGSMFSLDWTNKERIPTLLTDINLINYIQQYSKSKIV